MDFFLCFGLVDILLTVPGTLPQAIPGGTRPRVGGAHDKKILEVTSFFFFDSIGFVYSRWRSTVTICRSSSTSPEKKSGDTCGV